LGAGVNTGSGGTGSMSADVEGESGIVIIKYINNY
jgi:hypothetical protein